MSWIDSRVDIRPSLIHGLGHFAREPVPAGTLMAQWVGEIMPAGELDSLKTRPRYDCAAISEDAIIVFREDDPIIHGNHSCDPALWMSGGLALTARRDIAAGEEITVDYALHSDDAAWEMACACGSPLCRHVVRGDDWKRPDLQERYRGHFVPYLNTRIAQLTKPA
jgi:hypothetical protein